MGRINNASLIDDVDITDDLKIPTGAAGDLAISMGQIKNYNTVKRAVLEIGNFNMSSSGPGEGVSIDIGDIDFKKIRGVSLIIRNDDDDLYTTGANAVFIAINDGQIVVQRTGAYYDNASYNNDVDYNRGWVLIDYVS